MPQGELPVSQALAEAGKAGESLAELFARDPEGYQQKDLDRLIVELRAQRERFKAVESAGPVKKPVAAKASPKVLTLAGLGLAARK
jgi:hypothetical protein